VPSRRLPGRAATRTLAGGTILIRPAMAWRAARALVRCRDNPSIALHRAVFELGDPKGDAAIVAVSWVEMPTEAGARALKQLDRCGTGNVTDLSRERGKYRTVRYTGNAYASRLDRNHRHQRPGRTRGPRLGWPRTRDDRDQRRPVGLCTSSTRVRRIVMPWCDSVRDLALSIFVRPRWRDTCCDTKSCSPGRL